MKRKPVKLFLRAAWLAVTGRFVSRAEIASDYDRISAKYDENFSRHASVQSDALIDGIDGLREDARILDLACGTGAVAAAWRRRFPKAHITGVDASDGMLEVARRRCPDVEFSRGDMDSVLASVPDASLDAVSCAWAIGYADPRRIAREAFRALRPGGVFAVVENRRDTWPQVRNAAFGVAAEMPESLTALMDLHLRLPKSATSLGRMSRRAGFSGVETWEGMDSLVFADGRKVLDWSLGTGVSAGFDRAMDPARRLECDAVFVRLVERGMTPEGIRLDHMFVFAKGVKR